jgi:DNA-binding response OmpR family regulator
LRKFSQIPVLVVSARHSQETIDRVLMLGADKYITKPFDYKQMLKYLDEWAVA